MNHSIVQSALKHQSPGLYNALVVDLALLTRQVRYMLTLPVAKK